MINTAVSKNRIQIRTYSIEQGMANLLWQDLGWPSSYVHTAVGVPHVLFAVASSLEQYAYVDGASCVPTCTHLSPRRYAQYEKPSSQHHIIHIMHDAARLVRVLIVCPLSCVLDTSIATSTATLFLRCCRIYSLGCACFRSSPLA